MTDEINAQFGFERAFGKTNDNADADTKITKFGISFNSDGTTTFFAQLEKSSASQKEYFEKLQEKKAAEKKEAKKKEQSKQTEVRKTTVQANSKEELLDKVVMSTTCSGGYWFSSSTLMRVPSGMCI